jgi:hypothetical protein
MALDDKDFQQDQAGHADEVKPQPTASRVEDDDNLDEDDLKTSYLFGSSQVKDASAPGMESEGMGGEKFNQNNLTPPGNDAANPSQYAGNTNEYFRRNEPLEEHPENSNFKLQAQEGEPNTPGPGEVPDQQKVGEGGNSNSEQQYNEGTADNDGKVTPAANEPEKDDNGKEHIET